MKYILNTQTNTLHIEGYCHYPYFNRKTFDSEDEARAYGRLNIKNCKTCFKNRDKELISLSKSK